MLLLALNLLIASRIGISRSLVVTIGILFCFHMIQMKRQGHLSGSLVVAEVDLKSIPAAVVGCL